MTSNYIIPPSVAPTGSFLTAGEGVDIDAAFDDATTTAWFELGRSHRTASIATSSPEQITICEVSPMPFEAALRYAARQIDKVDQGAIIAVPFGTRSSYTRRKLSANLDMPTIVLPDEPGAIRFIPDILETELLTMSEPQGDEILDLVELRRPVKSRFKVQVTKIAGAKKVRFALYLKGGFEPLSVHMNVGEAKRAAVAYAKAYLVGVGRVEIRKETVIEDTNALLAIDKVCTAQKAAIRFEMSSPKPNVKMQGWVFAGRPVLNNEKAAQ
jgi:hypothetical protein